MEGNFRSISHDSPIIFKAVRTCSQVLPESFALLRQETRIGRDPACDIHLSWDGMSRNHARIVGAGGDHNLKTPSGGAVPTSFHIIDDGGSNGTFLNNVRVS